MQPGEDTLVRAGMALAALLLSGSSFDRHQSVSRPQGALEPRATSAQPSWRNIAPSQLTRPEYSRMCSRSCLVAKE